MSTSESRPSTRQIIAPASPGMSHVLQATRDERGPAAPEKYKHSEPAEKLDRIGGNVTSIFWDMKGWTCHGQGSRVTTDDVNGVRTDSQVSVSITEVDANGTPIVGLAGLAVYNVAPQDGKVTVHWWVGWDPELHIRLNYIIVN